MGLPSRSVTAAEDPGPVTLRGTVRPGVEHGCRLLECGGRTFQLVGPAARLCRPGQRVEVVGVVDPRLRTTGQQGTPVRVRSLRVMDGR
jgi:hypothetical protein